MSTRDELANIENKILEKKIAEKKKEELRKKNIAVSFVTIEKNNFANTDIFNNHYFLFIRCMETQREHKDFTNKIQTQRKRKNFFPIQNLNKVSFQTIIQTNKKNQILQ